MKLNFKRLMAMFLSIMMVVGMLPTMVFAEDEAIIIEEDGAATSDADFDFTDATGDESGDYWAWDNDTKTLTLSGASITTTVTLPEDSAIVATEGTVNSIIVTGAAPVTTSGDLTISGSGELTIKALAADANSAPAHTIVGAESITVTDTELTTYGFAGLSARYVKITNAKVDISGFGHAFLYEGTTGSTSVILDNVSGSLVSELDCAIELNIEYNSDNSAEYKDAAYVEIKNCNELTINGELTRTDKDNSSGHRSAIWVYTRDAETDAYVEISKSDVDLNGSGGGIFVNSHSDNSASYDASAAWVEITNSTVDIKSATYTWAAIFVNNNGTGENATADVTIEDSTVSSKAVHVGIMTSTKDAASTVEVENSKLTLGGNAAGIRVKANNSDAADAVVTNSAIFVEDSTAMVIDEMDNGTSGDATVDSLDGTSTVNGNVVVPAVTYIAQIGDEKFETLAAAFEAAQNGDEVKILTAGTYSLTGISGKNITVTGAVAGVEFANIGAFNMGSASVTFNNVTFTYASNSTYKGLQHSGNLEYNNCTFNGQVFLYGESETFNNCVFNTTDANNYNVWTYGAKEVEFNGCTFNSAGKSVLVYNEGACATELEVVDTDFIASAAVAGKAAIEIDTSKMPAGTKITVDDDTKVTGFATDTKSGSVLWNDKMADNSQPNGGTTSVVIVNGETVKDSVENVTYIAQIGETSYTSLEEAFAKAEAGDTVILTGDVTINENKAGIQIPDGVTFDGKGHTVTLDCYTGSYTTLAHFWNVNADANVTIKDITFIYKEGFSGDALAFADATLTNVNVTMNGGRFALVVSNKEGAEINLNNCTFTDNVGNYNIATDGNGLTALKIDGCIFNAQNYSLILRNSDSSVENSIFNGKLNLLADDVAKNVTGNTFNDRVKLYTNGETLTGNVFGVNGYVELAEASLTGIDVSGNYWGGKAPTATQVPEGVTCDSYYTELNANGTIKEDSLTTVAPEVTYVAKVGETKYTDLQEAIKAAAPDGTVEILDDVTVDKWIMFAENLSIANGNIITLNINGLTINGNGHTLTIKSIESAGNGNRLFYDAQNLNINDLTIKYVNDAANQGGIGLQSGTISGVNFVGGGYGVLPGAGDVTITGCTFATNSTAIYHEDARDNLVVTGCTFNQPANANVILLRGATQFMNNTVNSGRTVNVVSGSPVVTGNDFKTVRLKVYTAAEATISENTINVLAFEDGATTQNSTFSNNTMSDDAKAALAAVTPDVAQVGENKYATLQAAINNANGETVTLIADTTETITIADNANIVLDLGGNTLNGYIAPCKPTSLTVKNGSIKNTNSSKSAIEVNAGELTLTNVNIESARHAVRIDGAVTATINGGTYKAVPTAAGATQYAVNVSGGANVTIVDGTFVGPKDTAADSGAAVKVQKNSTVTIEGGNFSGGKNNTLSVEGTLIVKGGTFDQNPSAYVDEGYEAVKGESTWTVLALKTYVAQIGEDKYETLADAIEKATAGDTVTLIADVTEDVTVKKSITIDGANFKYTGNISANGDTNSTAVTVKNVIFENGTGYAITTNTIKSITVENCTVNNYGFGFLYANRSTPTVSVKNVTVTGGNYGFHWVYGTSATLENVTMTNVTNGLLIQNYAGKTINLKNCNISSIEIWERSGYSGVQTFKFEGANTVSALSTSQYAKYVLAAADATLTAAEGLNVTTNVVDSTVVYENGVYMVAAKNYVAQIGEDKYESLEDAIEKATAGDTVTLIADVTEDVTIDKDLTIDGAGKTYTGMMTLKADTKIMNVNFDGKGYNGYAVETRGADYLTIEDCTAKNYGYGFVQLASGTALTTIKNVTISNMNYGVKVDYSNAVVIENANIDVTVEGVLNSNYGEKTITIKNSKLNIYGTWTRNNTTKTTVVFEGENSVDKFVIGEAIDVFKLAADATLTAPNDIIVTTDVEGYEVKYADSKYVLVTSEVKPSATIVEKEASLLYRDIVQLRYKFEITGTFTNAYLLIWNNEADANARNMETAVVKQLTPNGTLYVGDSDGIAAKNMADLQYIVGVVETETGDAYTKTIAYSPLKYAEYFKNDATEGPLVNALMAYGAAAQIYFNYKTDTLMSDGFNVPAYDATKLLEKVTEVANNGNYGITAEEVRLVFAGAVEYKFIFAIVSAEVSKDWKMSYQFADGTSGIVNIEQNGNLYTATVPGRGAKDMDQVVKIVAYYGDTAPSDAVAVSYNGHDYVRSIVSSDSQSDSMKNLAKQFLMYIVAADARLSEN